ncbi:MAG: hypothetical protein GDA46_06095 [Bdellovibrionales bacterium]|nr:hypothetical protein [Bdellovibrionales bacterium]
MNIKKHRKDFNRRWNIPSSDNPKEAFKKFKQRILNIFQASYLNDSIDNLITDKGAFDFCQYYGIKEKRKSFLLINRVTKVIEWLKSENNE